MTQPISPKGYDFRPLTAHEWQDFVTLFDEPGPHRGCWCMYWRVKRADFHRQYGAGLQDAMLKIVDGGMIPGILAYIDGKPVGWCSIAPREEFPVLDRSPTLKRVDNESVWSIVCFFVSKNYRQQGISRFLLQAAIEHARERGAKIIEAYPLKTEIAETQPYERYMGLESTYEQAGFKVVTRRSERRPIMRIFVNKNEGEEDL
jgi:GNAT superfamily N-acetyltransferase